MPLLIPRKTQPQQFAPVNLAHPMTRGLVGFVCYPFKSGFYESLTQAPTSVSTGSGSKIKATSEGLALSLDGATRIATGTLRAQGVLEQNTTVIARMRLTALPSGNATAIQFGPASNGHGVCIGFNGSGQAFAGTANSGGLVGVIGDTTNHINDFVTVAGVADGISTGQVSLYVNGIAIGAGAFSGTWDSTAINTAFFGARAAGTVVFCAVDIVWCALFGRLLDADEIAWWHRYPYQVLDQQRNASFFSLPGAGGTVLTVDGLAALEFLSSLRRDSLAPVESAALFTRDAPAPTESLATMRRDGLTPAEWLSTLTRDSAAPGEFLAGVTHDGAAPLEWRGSVSVTVDGLAPLEWLGGVRRDGPGPLEFSGSLGVTVDGIAPLEWRTTLAVDGKAPTEFAAKLTADIEAPVEWLGSLARDSLVPLAWASTIIRDGNAPAEFTATLRLDGEAPAEWVVTIARDGSIPNGWLATLSRDGAAPLEFAGSAVFGTFDSLVPIEWVLLPNPSRGFTLLAPRWRYVALAPKLSYVAIIPGKGMPALRDLPPIDAVVGKQTIALDFGSFLPPGVTLMGTPTIQVSVHSGEDPDPQSHVTSGPFVGTAPTNIGGSGVTNAAIILQLGDLVAGVAYLVWGWCARSDGDEATGSTHTYGFQPT